MRRSPKIDWATQSLGEEYDETIARRVGVCRNTVRNARVRRGIPALGKEDLELRRAVLAAVTKQGVPLGTILAWLNSINLEYNRRSVHRVLVRLQSSGEITVFRVGASNLYTRG